MLASIIAAGLAVGAVYALIGVTYNVMFATSRVMSFTAGQLGMLGGVYGSLFALRLGVPLLPAFVLSLAACAVVGVATELEAVPPVVQRLRPHPYLLSGPALAAMIPQVHPVAGGSEPPPV